MVREIEEERRSGKGKHRELISSLEADCPRTHPLWSKKWRELIKEEKERKKAEAEKGNTLAKKDCEDLVSATPFSTQQNRKETTSDSISANAVPPNKISNQTKITSNEIATQEKLGHPSSSLLDAPPQIRNMPTGYELMGMGAFVALKTGGYFQGYAISSLYEHARTHF